MKRQITQRILRNESGRIRRALDKGDAFVVTRNGVRVAELVPLQRRVFVAAETAVAAFAGAARIGRKRFRKDIDRRINQDAAPRT